jgi:tetratricopeptide (TPR) repeat protein
MSESMQTIVSYDSDGDYHACEAGREALSLCPVGHPDRIYVLVGLADACETQFERLGDLSLLEEAIDLHRQALELRAPGHPDRPRFLNSLASALQNRCEHSEDLDSLAEAVELHRQALDLLPPDHPHRAGFLNNLANAVEARFEQLGDLNSLAEAIELHRQALDLRSPGHPGRPMSLNNLAGALMARFDHLGDLGSLAEAVELHRQALELHPPGHPGRSACLNNLANAAQTQFEQLGDLDLLGQAVELHRQALDLLPPGHSHRSLSLNNLASAVQTRFELLGDIDSLAEAVELHRQALSLRSPGHPDRSASLSNLAIALQTRFKQLGDPESLTEAVELHRQALDLLPLGHPYRSMSLNSLANALQSRFEQLGDNDSLAEVVELHRQALDLRSLGHPDRLMSLNNLATALQTRFEQLGDLDSLTEAIGLHCQALDLHPSGHPSRATCLTNLASAVQTRFEQLGDLGSLAEAIDLHRQALDLYPSGHPGRSASLSNLASALQSRFEHLDNLDSLDEAVNLHRQALDLNPPGHPNRSACLNNLANAVRIQFERLGGSDSIVEAVELHRHALDLRPPGHPHRSMSLNNLANAIQNLFEQIGDIDLLTEAMDLHRQCLALRPPGHPHRSATLNNLARTLGTRFEQLGDIGNGRTARSLNQCHDSDLIEELGLYMEGMHLCSDNHPMHVQFLLSIGMCMLRPGTHVFDFEDGVRHILEALRDKTPPASHSLAYGIHTLGMVEAAYHVSIKNKGALEPSQHHYDDLVLQVYILVIRLLPRAASFGLDHAGRLRQLARAETISRNAATRAMLAGLDKEAVEMLEEGRGVFWSQALRLRATDLDILPTQDAEALRKMFRTLNSGNMHLDSSTVTTAQQERQIEQRRKLSEAAEALIENIRSRPGMERFLLPPAFMSLMQSLPEGFIVFLNVSELGHHALVLNGVTRSAHSLPLMLPARLVDRKRKSYKQRLFMARADNDGIFQEESKQIATSSEEEAQLRANVRERATFEDSLADLWVFIVKPVIIDMLQLKVCTPLLQSLSISTAHLQKSNGRGRPRVWWCATGNLTFLPIHAAGGYTKSARERSGADSEFASDYIVSSYISSISTLVRARSSFSSIPRRDVKGLLIHEGSPGRGWSSITKVMHEVRRVKEHFDAAGASVTVVRPTRPDVLASLKETHIHVLHLACHGAQKSDPLASAFILRDEDLTIQDLMKLEVKQASLAFLSACQTAKGNQDQPDQAVHLAASMLFCGFKSVIATMRSD